MKKTALVFILIFLFSCVLCACNNSDVPPTSNKPESEIHAVENNNAHQVVGGWNTPEDGKITEAAKAAFDKAVKPGGISYTPVSLIGTQVVAGTNYAFVCIGKPTAPNAKPAPYLVIVYADLNGNAEIISQNPLSITR